MSTAVSPGTAQYQVWLPLLARIAERWPKVKVVLSSGYRDRYDDLPKGTAVLEKPYRAEDLLRRMHEELDIK